MIFKFKYVLLVVCCMSILLPSEARAKGLPAAGPISAGTAAALGALAAVAGVGVAIYGFHVARQVVEVNYGEGSQRGVDAGLVSWHARQERLDAARQEELDAAEQRRQKRLIEAEQAREERQIAAEQARKERERDSDDRIVQVVMDAFKKEQSKVG